jgi:hypothetical protein
MMGNIGHPPQDSQVLQDRCNELEIDALEAFCAHVYLDKKGVARTYFIDGCEYDYPLLSRIAVYKRQNNT